MHLRQCLLLIGMCLLSVAGFAQTSTALEVYYLFQSKCVSCHAGAAAPAGLNLQGVGATEAQRALSVYNQLVNQNPTTAAAAGLKRVYPGRPDKSFLFHKINQGLDPGLTLAASAGEQMPPYGQPQLSQAEIELVRQWIVHGAPGTGKVVEQSLLEAYYLGNGQAAYPDGPPPAPAPGEGFQIKMGPFFLAPGTEVEYFQKYELDLPSDLEVTRLDLQIAPYSHHLIVYDFGAGGGNQVPHGLRLNALHNNIGLVAAVQEATDLRLPQGSAFRWEQGLVLDLNAHYINYSGTLPYQAEAYINVYTQPSGVAAQEMHADLVANPNIFIPNNGNPVTTTQVVNTNLGNVYVWGLMGHTHRYGTGYRIWRRENGQATEELYDAACPQGVPGCLFPTFDYQHIPLRYFAPLEPVRMNFVNGLVHQASWVNDGPVSVGFGPTSDDEMMVMIVMYTRDTAGLVSTNEVLPEDLPLEIKAFPNPATEDGLRLQWPAGAQMHHLSWYDLTGREVYRQTLDPSSAEAWVACRLWPAGLYTYVLTDATGRRHAGRVMRQ